MEPGVTPSDGSVEGKQWNVVGHTYTPKLLSENAMIWHAAIPDGTFVPPHIHPTQDEFIYVLEGRFDVLLNGVETYAEPGDLIRLPKGIPHGIYNKTDQTIKCLFWVAPTRKLFDLFWALHNLGPDANPADVVAVSAKHEVDFLPPEEA